jgi:hypothetical protein
MNLIKYNVTELTKKDNQKTNGGFLIIGTLAAIAGIVYLAGEIAYMQGRADSGCDY